MTSEKVVVLAGGLSHERDVSLRSGRRAAQALRDVGHDVVELDVSSSLLARLEELGRPVVVPMLHGGAGEDGAIRQALELADVPFVGSTSTSARVAFDKAIATPRVAAAGFATPRQIALPDDMFRELGSPTLVAALGRRLGFPMMVKPARSGSALGCTKVERVEDLPAAMVQAYAYGGVAVVETFVTGTEVAVPVVDLGDGPVALPAVEIRPDSGVYDYTARYTAGATRFLAPAELDQDVADRCAELAVGAHRALGLRDLSRTDLIVDGAGTPVFLEANVAPGMTETSTMPLSMEAAGMDLGHVLSSLVSLARQRGAGA
ncbi:MAG: D-alanine--D-alanine ligase family protein [Propionibacteriaceae bacterium]